MLKEILLLSIGAILGYFVNGLFDKIKDFHIQRKVEKKTASLRQQFNKISFNNDVGVKMLDHGIPQYGKNAIHLSLSRQILLIPIPQEKQNELSELGFVSHQLSDFKHLEPFPQSGVEQCFSLLQIDDIQKTINEAAYAVANDFIDMLKRRLIRFNGLLFGVNDLRPNRDTYSEESLLNINFYTTDYFTFRVFAKIYQEYKDRFDLSSIESIIRYKPFLSSFGLDCFVILTVGNDDYIVIGHRGDNVIVDRNKLHFSMNEAFSYLDFDNNDMMQSPSLTVCLMRGLSEELGINNEYQSNIVETGFLDVGMETNRLELGISCYVRIKIDDKLTIEKFEDLYKTAKDKELETRKLSIVEMNKLEQYIHDNESDFSAGCRAEIRYLMARYNSKLILNNRIEY